MPHGPPPAIGQTLPAGLDERSVFRSLFAAYPDALLVVDPQGGIVLANPAAAQLLGYPVERLVGMAVDALVPDSIRPRHAAYRAAYETSPKARPMGLQMDLVARRCDGSEVMVEIALSPLQALGLPYVVAAIRGIGAYPRVRQALQRARYSEHVAQFGRLAVDARDPRLLIDEAPRVAAEALQVENAVLYLPDPNRVDFRIAAGIGLTADEAIGHRVPTQPQTLSGQVLAGERPLRIDDLAAERHLAVPREQLEAGLASVMAVRLSDRRRTAGALVVRSRTPRRFGDDEQRFLELLGSLLATGLLRAQSEEALSHSQRLESVGQLTGGIAHDFNNLLTVISGNLQVLEELPALAGDGFAQQLVDAAMRASRRGAELTGKLLAFSRRQVLQPTAVDAAALLLSLADMLRRTLDRRIRIEIDAEPGCPAVLADAGQLESALLNIAINARDAMPEGGTLAFGCRTLPPDAPDLPVELADAADGRFVAISITDTGCGMPEAVKERAFEPFFTTKEAGRGTGLGLSTVYGFARQSRGAVTIASRPGAGTTLRLVLPCVQAEAGTAEAADAPAEHLPAGLRVLLVEDDAEVRSVAQRFLAALGCDLRSCVSGEQALPLLAQGGDIDVLLTDIALGTGMRGTELARRARALRPDLPVLLTSGFSSALLDAPAGWDLLRKPYRREELARALARVLGPRQTAP